MRQRRPARVASGTGKAEADILSSTDRQRSHSYTQQAKQKRRSAGLQIAEQKRRLAYVRFGREKKSG